MNRKLLVSIVMGVLIVVGYVVLFGDKVQVKDQTDKRTEEEVQNEIKDLQVKIYDIKSVDTADSVTNEIKRLQQEIMQASSGFPKDADISSFLRELSTIGDSNSLQILLFEPLQPVNQGVYEEIPIKVKIRGTYKQLAAFFYGVANLNRIVRVQEMKITGPINNSGIIMTEGEILMTTYRIVGGA